MAHGPSPASQPLGTLSPKGRGDQTALPVNGTDDALGSSLPSPLWGEGGAQRRVRGRKVTAAGVARARALRQLSTEAEKRLWNLLRNRLLTVSIAPTVSTTPAPAQQKTSTDVPAQRKGRSIRIRTAWAVGDASGIQRQGYTDQQIDFDD